MKSPNKTPNKSRRSPRIPARHNIMLIVDGKEGEATSKEVVTTMHISRHGAHLIGRRRLNDDSKGKIAHLSTCRQAPFRIAWQEPSKSQPGYHEMGIEFIDLADFWGDSYSETPPAPAVESASSQLPPLPEAAGRASNNDVLEVLRAVPPGSEGREITDAIWCGLVEQLEERRVITRGELIASLRKVGLQLD